jgi:hypothetical protein
MTSQPPLPRFDGLMDLAKREGVDIRPTLLRVLTDLYVQTAAHSAEEERHYSELASRLLADVDDATRAAVRARLAAYPLTPPALAAELDLPTPEPAPLAAAAPVVAAAPVDDDIAHACDDDAPLPETRHAQRAPATLTMQPTDASAIDEMFAGATTQERMLILGNLETSALTPAARPDAMRNAGIFTTLERAAFAADRAAFTECLAGALLVPLATAQRIVADDGGEMLACAAKALGTPPEIFERMLMFLRPELGSDTMRVFRLSRLYDGLGERAALVMLAVWRGAMVARIRNRHRPVLHDDERRRARPAPLSQPAPAARPATPARRFGGGEG